MGERENTQGAEEIQHEGSAKLPVGKVNVTIGKGIVAGGQRQCN